MGLLGQPLDRSRATLETAIRGLGADPERVRSGADAWVVRKGSATVIVRLLPDGSPRGPGVVRVDSPVMKVPPAPGFAARVLALNQDLGGLAGFTLTPDGELHLTYACHLRGLGPTEVAQLVAHVAHYSDLYDDRLLAEFGVQYGLRRRGAS